MRKKVMLAWAVAAACLSGCALDTGRLHANEQHAPRPAYSASQVQAMQTALSQYISDNKKNLSLYRTVVAGKIVLNPGTLQGQSFNPGTSLLRQMGYLAFEAPDVQAWVDPVPGGCIHGRCAFVGHVVTEKNHFLVPVDY